MAKTAYPSYPKPKNLSSRVGKIEREEAAESSIEKKAALKPMTGKSSCKR